MIEILQLCFILPMKIAPNLFWNTSFSSLMTSFLRLMSTLSMWFSMRFSKSMMSFSNFGRFLVFTSNNSQCLLWNQYSLSASFGFLTQVFSKSVSLWNIYFALLKIPQMILSCIIASKSKYRHPMWAKIRSNVQFERIQFRIGVKKCKKMF